MLPRTAAAYLGCLTLVVTAVPSECLHAAQTTEQTVAADLPPDPVTGHHEAAEGSPHAEPIGQVATSPAGIVTFGPYVSIQVNVNAQGLNIGGDAANEPSLAVDPNRPTHMAIGWRQFDSVLSNFRKSGYGYTQDGGQTWTFPGVLEPNTFSSDPVLEADADGRFYYYALQPDRGPGEWACYLYASDDGGVTWPQEVYAWGGDKAWMTIDKTGGIGRGNLYMYWSVSYGCCGFGHFTRSTNGGLTFLAPIALPQFIRWGTLTVDPDGRLFLVGSVNSSTHYVLRSTNAQNPSQAPVFELTSPVNLGGSVPFGEGPNPGGLLGQFWIDADHSLGPARGNIYVLASLDPPGGDPLDVLFSRSVDGGVTWSPPIRINDDAAGTNAWQWFGTMSVAPNGRIDVFWNDTRADPSVTFSQLYYASSNDGGLTWTPNTPVSPSFNHFLGYPDQNKIGDYYDMASDNFGVSIAYAATFNGEQDVYFLRIGDFDCNQNGYPDQEDIEENRSDDCDENGVPDECDPNCNQNEWVDACETLGGLAPDCNNNYRPDECDPDWDFDKIPDACDPDIDGDGVANSSDVCDFTPAGITVDPGRGTAKGDYNRDCVINLFDLTRLIQCFAIGGPGAEIPTFCVSVFDVDGDKDFDLRDLDVIFRFFGQ